MSADDFDFASSDVLMARALYPYLPDPASDDTEIAFSKGEVLRVRNAQRARWWVARNEKGEVGMVPSNYLNVLTENEMVDMRRMGAGGVPALDGATDGNVPDAGAAGAAAAGPVLSPMARRMQGQRPMWDRMGDRASGWGWS